MNAIKKILYGLIFTAIVVGCWNLYQLLYNTFVTHNGYQFDLNNYILIPAAIGAGLYLLLFVFDIFKNTKK